METFPYVIDLATSSSVTEAEIGLTTLITSFENGKEQRRSKGTPRKSWTKRWKQLEIDADLVWAFFLARAGCYEAFTLNIKDRAGLTTGYTVRFDTDALSREIFYGVLFSTGITFVEVI
jgi:hypothetical protein